MVEFLKITIKFLFFLGFVVAIFETILALIASKFKTYKSQMNFMLITNAVIDVGIITGGFLINL